MKRYEQQLHFAEGERGTFDEVHQVKNIHQIILPLDLQ
jgi:hypothetical protein